MNILMGYVSEWSVGAGDVVDLMVSSDSETVACELVKLKRGGPRPGGMDVFAFESVSSDATTSFDGHIQDLIAGSYAATEDFIDLGETFTAALWIYPTAPSHGPQAIISQWQPSTQRGWKIAIDDAGALELRWFDRQGEERGLSATGPLAPGHWYQVAVAFDLATNSATLKLRLDRRLAEDRWSADVSGPYDGLRQPASEVIIAGSHRVGGHPVGDAWPALETYNGKIGAVELACAETSIFWDMAASPSTRLIPEKGAGNRDLVTFNSPLRAVTGHTWSGEVLDHRLAPDQYAAIHFHTDDMDDAGWTPSLSFRIPGDLPSGIYAFRLSTCDAQDFVPLFVTPAPTATRAKVAFIVPTLSYLAYSNFDYSVEHAESLTGTAKLWDEADDAIVRFPGIGRSAYGIHDDGSGVAHVSRRRPMLNIRPQYKFFLSNGGGWCLSADMNRPGFRGGCGVSRVLRSRNLWILVFDIRRNRWDDRATRPSSDARSSICWQRVVASPASRMTWT